MIQPKLADTSLELHMTKQLAQKELQNKIATTGLLEEWALAGHYTKITHMN